MVDALHHANAVRIPQESLTPGSSTIACRRSTATAK